jgi:urease accessory protein
MQDMAMTTEPLNERGLYRLMTWLSPSFPVGAFTYSHGIEFAVEEELITDRSSLQGWIESIVRHGAGQTDALLLRVAWQAVTDNNPEQLNWAVEMADALRATPEMALESTAQGQAFLGALSKVSPDPDFLRWATILRDTDRPPAYGVVVGIAAATANVPLRPSLVAFLHAMSGNLVSAGVRLIPLGQTDGQLAQAALETLVHKAADRAITQSPDDLGASAPMIDWTSMQHETQYTRLFRS